MQYDGDLCVERAKNWPYLLVTNCNEQQISINCDAIDEKEEKEVKNQLKHISNAALPFHWNGFTFALFVRACRERDRKPQSLETSHKTSNDSDLCPEKPWNETLRSQWLLDLKLQGSGKL